MVSKYKKPQNLFQIAMCSNCNVCGAINFKKEHSSNKSVDTLTEIWIGNATQQKITLCNDCLKELSKELNNYIAKTT